MAYSKGHIPWNKGKQGLQIPWNKGKTDIYSDETKEKLSKSLKGLLAGEKNPMYGKHHSKEIRYKIGCGNRGKSFSAEIKKKLSESRRGEKNPMHGKHRYGENNPNWKGGISSISNLIRTSAKYFEWHQNCLIKDNFTCQKCGIRGGNLHVHHKKSFATLFKELINKLPLFSSYAAAMVYMPLWDLGNGITLCGKCHKPKRKEN